MAPYYDGHRIRGFFVANIMRAHRPSLLFAALALAGALGAPGSARAQTAAPVAPQPRTDQWQAGGLAPPPPMPTDPSRPSTPPSQTEQQLERSVQKDSGRGLQWVYVTAEVGFETMGLETFSANGLTFSDATATTGSGPSIGAGAGIQLLYFTVGPRARIALFPQWNLTTIGGDVGARLPIGELEPVVLVGGGYATLSSMKSADWGADVRVRGYFVRIGAGLDYYLTPVFSVGGLITGELLGLSRPAATLPASASPAPQVHSQTAAADGSSMGSALTVSAVLGLHF